MNIAFMLLMLFVCVLEHAECTLYKIKEEQNKQEIRAIVLAERKAPSKITCVHYCNVKGVESIIWYEGGNCKCLLNSKSSTHLFPAKHSLSIIPTVCPTSSSTFESLDTNQICFCTSKGSGDLNCKEIWTLINDNVCYEGKGDRYGEFTLTKSGEIVAIKLEHISGLITCMKSNSQFGSGVWTCNFNNKQLSTVITDVNKNVIFPPNVTMSPTVEKVIFGDKEAFEIRGKELFFTKPTINVNVGDKLQIWNTNDYGDTYDSDNAGRHCVKVFVKYK